MSEPFLCFGAVPSEDRHSFAHRVLERYVRDNYGLECQPVNAKWLHHACENTDVSMPTEVFLVGEAIPVGGVYHNEYVRRLGDIKSVCNEWRITIHDFREKTE